MSLHDALSYPVTEQQQDSTAKNVNLPAGDWSIQRKLLCDGGGSNVITLTCSTKKREPDDPVSDLGHHLLCGNKAPQYGYYASTNGKTPIAVDQYQEFTFDDPRGITTLEYAVKHHNHTEEASHGTPNSTEHFTLCALPGEEKEIRVQRYYQTVSMPE